MPFSDYHTHTVWSDGKNTPEEMVLEAIRRGMPELGISDHSYTAFEDSYCMKRGSLPAYLSNLAQLKEKYAGQITLRRGLEQDYWSEPPEEAPEYIIGSVHYIKTAGGFIPVDDAPEILLRARDEYFHGDIYSLAEAYYDLVGGVAEKTGCDIIGHFDLVTKFTEKVPFLDTAHPRYIAAWQRAADRLLPSGKLFEINTGAISRGYRTSPYPAGDILTYLKDRGARFILSGDSHSGASLAAYFEEYAAEDLPFAPLFS